MLPEMKGFAKTVQAINEQRGCPYTLRRAETMSEVPATQLTADARKQEYYFLLDTVLPPVVNNIRSFRRDFPDGIVRYADDGVTIVSGLGDLERRAGAFVEAGDFVHAMYEVHDAVYRTIDIATEEWLRNTDTSSPTYQRINQLVDDPRQEKYGGIAIQKRVSTAANQTVLISASFQRFIEQLYAEKEGRKISAPEMESTHGKSQKLAISLTQLHLLETRFIREILGSETLLDGRVQLYTHPEYFALEDGELAPAGDLLVEKLAEYPGQFPDGRIGCPGARYIPEIWRWAGDLSGRYASPALPQAA